MKVVHMAILAGVLGVGCSGKPKDDFAGFSFQASKTDLEQQGFTCKEGKGHVKFECVNLDWKGSVLGQDVRGVTISKSEKKGASFIAAKLAHPPETLAQLMQVQTSIDQLYTHQKEKDMAGAGALSAYWARPDGATLKFVHFQAWAGLTPTKAEFMLFDPT